MTRPLSTALLLSAAILSTSGQTGRPGEAMCREIHYHANGTVTEKMVPDPERNGQGSGSSSSASAHSSGVGSAQSSVAVSSSSRGGKSRARASVAGDDGRSVEVEREGGSCTIRITER